MADIIGDLLNNQWFILLILVIIIFVVIITWLLKRKPKGNELKRISMYKSVKDHLDVLFQSFAVNVNIPFYLHLDKKGTVKKYLLLHWNRNLSFQQNLEANENINKSPEIQKNLDTTDTIKMYALKILNKGLLNKIIGYLGYAHKYHIVNENNLSIKHNEIRLNPYLEPQPYYDVFIYSEVAKDYIDNISFRINREMELEELSNIVPKQTYLELEQSKRIEQLDVLNETLRDTQKDRIDQIRKAKV
jgi:hypothetical protein